ncbi:MAG: hypothetical protein AB1898_24580 [Acidobacteriota bacterium]
MKRRDFLLGAALVPVGLQVRQQPAKVQYDSIQWLDERQDPSVTLETEGLVAKIIDNTGLKTREGDPWMKQEYSHYLGYHGIRALWHKEERRNIVAPFFSWLNLQSLRVEGLELDPVDFRSRFGVGRGWPIRLFREGTKTTLHLPRMPLSGVEYRLTLWPSAPDAIDFEVEFRLHRKVRDRAAFGASWPCYMSTYDEVALYAPTGEPHRPVWREFGERESFVVGEAVGYVHRQRTFRPDWPVAFPAVYGRIGGFVLAMMVNRPEVSFFVVNAGGHRSFLPVQNPAWDFSFQLPDYNRGEAFGYRGRLLYRPWTHHVEITERYFEWKRTLAQPV